jgi:hypothetical protein
MVPTHSRHTMRFMQSPALARQSVPADVSEFARAELEAFVAFNRRRRPAAWARVERLQRLCQVESPTTTAGFDRSRHVMTELVVDRDALPGGVDQDGHANALRTAYQTA